MNVARYRSDIDAFIDATDWVVDGAVARGNMALVLQWFRRNVPAAVLDRPADAAARRGTGNVPFRPANGPWTMLMSWMQAIRFAEPVDPQSRVRGGDRLIAFRTRAVDRASHRFGHFYVRADPRERAAREPGSRGLGIPSGQTVATCYEARWDFTCLETCAGDAFLSWAGTDQSYAHGGSRQLFIWQADHHLRPLF